MKTGMERIGVSTEYLENDSNAFASSIDRLKDFTTMSPFRGEKPYSVWISVPISVIPCFFSFSK